MHPLSTTTPGQSYRLDEIERILELFGFERHFSSQWALVPPSSAVGPVSLTRPGGAPKFNCAPLFKIDTRPCSSRTIGSPSSCCSRTTRHLRFAAQAGTHCRGIAMVRLQRLSLVTRVKAARSRQARRCRRSCKGRVATLTIASSAPTSLKAWSAGRQRWSSAMGMH